MNALVQHQVSDIERMARAFAASKLFGVQNVEQALALCLIAQAEGRHPASAAADYHIMNGKPAKKAEAMLRDFLAGGGKVEWHTLTDTQADATFSHPAGGSARIDWTMERAKKAQLSTPMWTKYPRQMLRSRTVSEGVRTVYPMATSGMYEPGEVADFAEPKEAPLTAVSDMRDVTPRDEPKAAQPSPTGIRRVNSAEAKRLGLDVTIKDALSACETRTDLAQWDAEFDKHTAQLPVGWLDSVRNQVILRGEEIDAEQAAMDGGNDDELTAQFKASVQREFPGARVVEAA